MTSSSEHNWYCIEVKQSQRENRRLLIAPCVRDNGGQIITDPAIGNDVVVNSVQGQFKILVIYHFCQFFPTVIGDFPTALISGQSGNYSRENAPTATLSQLRTTLPNLFFILPNWWILGTLIASSIFGITPLDVFDEIMTGHSDMNIFLADNNQPTYSTYSGQVPSDISTGHTVQWFPSDERSKDPWIRLYDKMFHFAL